MAVPVWGELQDLATPERVLLLVALVISGLTFKSLLDGMTNPLKNIPGPWYARWTDLPLKAAIVTGRRIFHVNALHETYGPHILIAPSHVSILSPEGFAKIHKVGTTHVKSSWYARLVSMERPMVFTMSDRKTHSERRKMYSRPFSKASLQADHESTIHNYVRSTLAQMKKTGAQGQPVDILKWWMLMASDVVSKLMLGKCFEGIQRGEVNDHLRAMKTSAKGKGILIELPKWLAWILRRIPARRARELFNPNPITLRYGKFAIEEGKAEGGKILFANAVQEAAEGIKMDDLDILIEGSGLITAGTDTTANTLTYLVWAVLSHPQWQTLLEEEVANLNDNFTSAQVEKLPVLNAIVDETLRLYGAAPGAMQRVVPLGGTQFGKVFVPQGTIVSTQAYSFHRDPTLFADPYRFDPNRFIAGTDAKLPSAALAVYHPFGAGSHICLGMHLARIEMQLAVAEFFRQCRGARLAPTTTEDSMRMVNFFLVMPKSHRCDILL